MSDESIPPRIVIDLQNTQGSIANHLRLLADDRPGLGKRAFLTWLADIIEGGQPLPADTSTTFELEFVSSSPGRASHGYGSDSVTIKIDDAIAFAGRYIITETSEKVTSTDAGPTTRTTIKKGCRV